MGQHSIGERFGDYTLVRPLGEGGFASVYLGQEVHKGTSAAIKLPKEQQVHDFINELRRTILLQHPNIIKILDFGIRTPDNTAFIIMEYAPNGSFREKFPRGTRVPLDVVVTSVKQVASALQYAHDQRVIHRDVKPENLLLNARNMVLLSDFGIATANRTAMTSNTAQGDIIGTYAYMAPEQLKGRPVPASDQYSLAIMVYEWLCGELPFEAREFMQWRYQHQEVPPPSLRDSVPSLAPAVEQVVLRALAKKPEERFERVETFASALEQASHPTQPIVTGPLPTPPPFSTSQPSQRLDLNLLYKEGVKARSQGNLERTALLWQQILDQDPQFQFGTLALQMKKLLEELTPWRIKRLWDAVEQAHTSGNWGQEIVHLQTLLGLEPNNTGIKARIAFVEQHQKYKWMYEIAFQFVQEQALSEARTQLEMLWQEDPEFGDPAGLAQKMGMIFINEGVSSLRVEEGKELGRIYEIRKESLSIGRSRESDIFVEDLALSRLHASIVSLGNGNFGIKDEGSANGSKVNGQALSKFQTWPLQPGDKIQFGQTVLSFQRSSNVQLKVPRVCPFCGSPVHDNRAFCMSCGNRILS